MVRSHPTGGGVPAPSPLQLLTAFNFSIFPVSGKRPTGSWAAYQERLAEPHTLADWLKYGNDFGLATGPVSGVVVVDTDTPEAEEWVTANLPPTPWAVLTGIKDPETGFRGRHRYYRYPSEIDGPITNRAAVKVGGLKTGLDIRGQGGYVVAPGSRHESGVHYEPTTEWNPSDKDKLPIYRGDVWFEEADRYYHAEGKTKWLTAPSVLQRAKEGAKESQATDRAKKWLSKREVPSVGGRNTAIYSTAASLYDFGLSFGDVLALVLSWNSTFPDPLPENEVHQTVVSAETSRQAAAYPKGTKVGTSSKRSKAARVTAQDGDAGELPDDEDEDKQSQFDQIMEATDARMEFFVCGGEPYLSPGDALAIPLESHKAEQHIRLTFFEEFGKPPSSENVKKFVDIRAAQLSIHGEECPVFRRVGKVGEKHFLDLCNEGKVIELTADGWKVVQNPEGVYFTRTGATEDALPIPEPGGDVLVLSQVVNTPDQYLKLLLTYLVTALRTGVPYVVLVLEGEAGSGKSTLTRVLKYLIDPSKELLRTFPGSERDFAVYAHNSHFLTLDNVDRITNSQSDMLCRAATGGGFSARTHYSMTDETVISIQRPVVITGIQGLVERADMADRVALVQLERVADGERIPEADLWPLVEKIRPQVLGGLLDAFVAGLANLEKTKLDRLPRMADFAKFATAAEVGLPWEQGEALAAYQATRENLFEQALEKDVVATAIYDFLSDRLTAGIVKDWIGTSSDLLSNLTVPLGLEERWPRKGSKLGKRLSKAAPLLRQKGVTISHSRTGKGRFIHLGLRSVPGKPSLSSLSSQTSDSSHSRGDKTGDSSKTEPSPNCHSESRVTEPSHPKQELSPELSHNKRRGYGESDESDRNDSSAGTPYTASDLPQASESIEDLPEGFERGII
jgi:energy-coupling factor transporter ATP-binding protein EcfA2